MSSTEPHAILVCAPITQHWTGMVFDRRNDSGWQRYAPPLGYNCRCAMVTVRPGRVDDSAVIPSTALDIELGPDPGWVGPGGT